MKKIFMMGFCGTSFCNTLYWNGLVYIRDQELETKMFFLYIPFWKNMTAPEDFCEGIRKGMEKYENFNHSARRIGSGSAGCP